MSNIWRSDAVMRLRELIARFRRRFDPFYIAKWKKIKAYQIEANRPYEEEKYGYWRPTVMGLEETLRYIMEKKCSVTRFGDGEMELVAGRDMLFENANSDMQKRLTEILGKPIDSCLLCVPNSYGSLGRYVARDVEFWRDFALWSRPILEKCLHPEYNVAPPNAQRVLGDPHISRPYLGFSDKSIAPRVFALWKELFSDKDILIVEGRFSRLGIGNDLLDSAKSIRRIWCPPKFAFARYNEILAAVKKEAKANDLILLALGATATILAYDLSKAGLWAVDTGHLDVEYMWMKMGAMDKVAILGRYVSEVTGAQEQVENFGEERRDNVVAKVGC